ncbi:histone H1-like [Hoplias malabaricus]|uniref:histone H1-like n=1 Tax=Hoplias malabaricus TaxID=27720 RepID=UPI0034628544
MCLLKAVPSAGRRFLRTELSLCVLAPVTNLNRKMAEVAPAPAAAAPAKATKKKAAARPKKSGPSVGELIVKAVSESKERSGVSLAALKKALAAGGYDVEKNNSRVKAAVKSLVTKGTLVQTKGTGASGSFKLNKKQSEAKKVAPKAKKPAAKKPAAAKKPKKVAAKKPAAATAKKSPKKVKKPAAAKKSPKKVKKPAAAKKVAKSPKKAKKPTTPKKAKKPTTPKKTKAVKPKAAKPKAKKAAPKKK